MTKQEAIKALAANGITPESPMVDIVDAIQDALLKGVAEPTDAQMWASLAKAEALADSIVAFEWDHSEAGLYALRLVQRAIENPEMRTHLHPKYRTAIEAGAHPHTGFCVMASDALRRFLGGQVRGFSGYKLCRVVHEGGPHYYLTTPSGAVLDATVAQFQWCPPYADGRGQGLSTPSRIFGTDVQSPTKGAAALLACMQELQAADDMADFDKTQGVHKDAHYWGV